MSESAPSCSAALDDGAEELRSALEQIFAPLEKRLLPADAVRAIISNEVAEDGETLYIDVELAGGRVLMISICPGEPVSCTVHCVGECDGSVPCDLCGCGTTNEEGG